MRKDILLIESHIKGTCTVPSNHSTIPFYTAVNKGDISPETKAFTSGGPKVTSLCCWILIHFPSICFQSFFSISTGCCYTCKYDLLQCKL